MDTRGPEFNTEAYNNGNAVVGAILGAIGANGENVISRGSEIRIPASTVLRFRLEEPLHLVGWQDPGCQNNGYHYHDWYR